MSMLESSLPCVVGRGCLLWPTLLDLPCFILYSKAKFACYSGYLLTSYFFIPVLWNGGKWKGHLLGVLLLEGLVGHHRSVQPHFFSITGWGIDLDYCDIEWFASEMNRDHSLLFEIVSKYCISDSFVDYDGYSISSKGSLPTVVDIMIIWVKFTHSSPF